MDHLEKVVITGIGVLSPFGVGAETFWNSLLQGLCGIRPVTRFPVQSELYPCKIAAEVPAFDPEPWQFIEDPAWRGRYADLALPALGMALDDAELEREEEALGRAGLFMGSAQETGDCLEQWLMAWLKEKGPELPGDILAQVDPHAVTAAIARNFGIKGEAISLSTSCASGVLALMLCEQKIRSGRLPLGVVVGADAISPFVYFGEGLTGELSKRNQDPEHASRPFDRDQDGYVIGEGAVALVVESEAHALAREARIYAELGPIVSTTDATSFRYIDAEGRQMSRGMELALQAAPAKAVDYISAHGPSIKALDRAESVALRRAFGPRIDRIPVTSIKGATGNPSAAGGMLQIVSALLSLRDGAIPPTLNLQNPLPGCDLDYVKTSPRRQDIQRVFISAHGGGGVNAALTVQGYT